MSKRTVDKDTGEIKLDSDGCNWQGVQTAIRRGDLLKLKRVAGSLGDRADQVRYGLDGPTFERIGDVIGREQPAFGR